MLQTQQGMFAFNLFKVPPGGVTALTSINFYRQMEKIYKIS